MDIETAMAGSTPPLSARPWPRYAAHAGRLAGPRPNEDRVAVAAALSRTPRPAAAAFAVAGARLISGLLLLSRP